MAEVIVRPGAQADIREAALWYESRRPGLGSEFALRLRVARYANSVRIGEVNR